MEFCVGGNLRVLIQALKKMSIKDRKMKCYMPFYQMLSSLAHLHSLGIVHRDLKPENVFLDENGNTKTADFGLASTMISKSYLKSAGTAVYAPSEAHMQNKMIFASDIWVLAVIIIEMLTGVHPYAGRTQLETIENIKKGKMVVPLPDYINGELKEMLMNMLYLDADKRPTAKELLDTQLMFFQDQIDKYKEITDQQSKKINELEAKVNTLEIQLRIERQDKEKENKKQSEIIKLKDDEMWNLLNILDDKQDCTQITSQQWIEMKNELEKEERGTDSQIEEIRKKKIDVCQEIILAFSDGQEHNEIKKQTIEAGVIDALLHLFNSQPLESITLSHIWTFFVFTYNTSNEICLLITEKKPYPALFRLLDHKTISVVSRATSAILNILIGVTNLTPVNQPHPHFQSVESCGGIDKLYSLFKKNLSPGTKTCSARCIGNLFKAKEITNIDMRKDIFAYLKTALSSSESWIKDDAKWPLKMLAENSVNRLEIEKDGFKIPE
ncbi:MAG: putative G2-specific protein kinase NimA [Streblomastix strix]|uniref:Putative G2-specific protein kinase NimA n=1 Tax=Streblomastix strix TaxID=222440 RepID=A0A5J4UI90_9EUKA|nr:MAG: putative G2-specific protein kinase NimA [Streblomastix strix]